MTTPTSRSLEAEQRHNGARLLNRSPALAERRAAHVPTRRSTIHDWTAGLLAPPVQLDAFERAMNDLHDGVSVGNHEVWGDPLPAHLPGGAVQLRERIASRGDGDPRAVAAQGTRGSGASLPHLETISAAFGRHDVSGVRAFVGGAAREASDALGARAYAMGDAVAFGAAPDLHTAAHEAAHTIQQRSGVNLAGGIGQAGDAHERHADAVADAVVSGQDAEPLLDAYRGGAGAGVQLAALPGRVSGSEPAGEKRLEVKVERDKQTTFTVTTGDKGTEAKVEGYLWDPSRFELPIPLIGVKDAGVWVSLRPTVRVSGSGKIDKAGDASFKAAIIGELQLMLKGGVKWLNLYGGGTARLQAGQVELKRVGGAWQVKRSLLSVEGDLRCGLELKPLGGKRPVATRFELRTPAAELLVIDTDGNVKPGKSVQELLDTMSLLSEQSIESLRALVEAGSVTLAAAKTMARAVVGGVVVASADARNRALWDAAMLPAMLRADNAQPGPAARDPKQRAAVEALLGTLYGFVGEVPDFFGGDPIDDGKLLAWHQGLSADAVAGFAGVADALAALGLDPAEAARLGALRVVPFMWALAHEGLVAFARDPNDVASEKAGPHQRMSRSAAPTK